MSWVEDPRSPVYLNLMQRNELAAGPRLGGSYEGLKTDTSGIWKGRPPLFADGIGPMTLAIAATPNPNALGQTVTIEGEFGNAFGGIIRRRFHIGGGLSADLRAGNFAHVKIQVVPDPLAVPNNVGIPAGMTVFFCWTWNLNPIAALFFYQDYPVAAVGTTIQAPEGCEFIHVQNAGTLTFVVTEYGQTWVRAVAAGERVPCPWGAFSCNVANRFIFEMRGL